MADEANPGNPPPAAHPVAKKTKPVKKLRSELTSAEAAKLDAESAKRRNRRTKVAEKKAAVDYAAKATVLHKAVVEDKEAIVAKAPPRLAGHYIGRWHGRG